MGRWPNFERVLCDQNRKSNRGYPRKNTAYPITSSNFLWTFRKWFFFKSDIYFASMGKYLLSSPDFFKLHKIKKSVVSPSKNLTCSPNAMSSNLLRRSVSLNTSSAGQQEALRKSKSTWSQLTFNISKKDFQSLQKYNTINTLKTKSTRVKPKSKLNY